MNSDSIGPVIHLVVDGADVVQEVDKLRFRRCGDPVDGVDPVQEVDNNVPTSPKNSIRKDKQVEELGSTVEGMLC